MNVLLKGKRGKFSDDITNEFTKELDKHTKGVTEGAFSNYIYSERIKRGENKFLVSFRYPGATRGHLELDRNNVIKDIQIYKDSRDIYEDTVDEAVKKFIGYRLEF